MSQPANLLRLSVIINNYNYGQYIEECIQSVLNQSRSADEIIIVDDGSTDNSVEIIRKFEGQVRLLTQPNGGQLSAIVTGVEAATGDFLLFLDSDDLWNPDHLETVEKVFNEYPSVDCLFTKLQLFGNDEGPHVLNIRKFPNRLKCSRFAAYYSNFFLGRPTSACVFKSEVVKKVIQACKGLEDDFRICADRILINGTSLIGAEKMFIDDCTVLYRTHGENGYYAKEKNGQALALAEHRKNLINQKILAAYPFKFTPDAVVKEMLQNGSAELHGVFYRNIAKRMKLSYLADKYLRWRLGRLRRKLANE